MKKTEGAPVNKIFMRIACFMLPLFFATACALVDVPEGTSPKVSAATPPLDRYEGLNEKRDPITRVKLGRDVLVPQPLKEDDLPADIVGPYELRGETLASALQLILDDYDISLAFETDDGLRKRVTVSNLRGRLRDVVRKVCSLADLYCRYEDGALTVKKTETFVVDLPPISMPSSAGAAATGTTGTTAAATTTGTGTTGTTTGASNEAYTQIAGGLAAVIGSTPVVDTSTRVMIYTATQRSNKYALKYFERLRKNTALIIFETNIWEVTLNHGNRTGIDWTALLQNAGNMQINLAMPGPVPTGTATPITITPTYTNGSGNLTTTAILGFISEQGAVKTVSQPQIAVLSGSSASLTVKQVQNYVSSTARTASTVVGQPDTVTAATGTVDTGLTMNVTSSWDQSTVYGNLNIVLNDLIRIEEFAPDAFTKLQLPQTTERSLQTGIRVRPGDAILIGGIVSERNNLAASGPGFMKPLFATSREVSKTNTELVFLLRPRVVAFEMGDDSDTPAIADAPKEGILSPTRGDRHIEAKAFDSSGKSAVEYEPLPSGISAEAFAPQPTSQPLVEDLPASLQDLEPPIPLSVGGGDEDPSNEGSINR